MRGDGDELTRLVGPFWSAAKVVDALGLGSGQALDDLLRGGRLLGLTTSDGHKIFPVLQFGADADGVAEVLPGLAPVLTTLRGHDGWAVAVLLRTPAAELGSRTPLEWIAAEGDPAALATLARRVDAEWST